MRRHIRASGGFTLIELAIVISIIAIMTAAILKGWSMVHTVDTDSVISMAKDLSSAAQTFKQRYHYLPGDFPVDQNTPEITGVIAGCRVGGANAGNGNGLIDIRAGDNEPACVREHLIRSGLVQGDTTQPFMTKFGTVSVVAVASSNTGPAAVLRGQPLSARIVNVIEFANLPCELAQDIDRKLDDGNFATGNIQASVATCDPVVPTNDPVPFLAMPL